MGGCFLVYVFLFCGLFFFLVCFGFCFVVVGLVLGEGLVISFSFVLFCGFREFIMFSFVWEVVLALSSPVSFPQCL